MADSTVEINIWLHTHSETPKEGGSEEGSSSNMLRLCQHLNIHVSFEQEYPAYIPNSW